MIDMINRADLLRRVSSDALSVKHKPSQVFAHIQDARPNPTDRPNIYDFTERGCNAFACSVNPLCVCVCVDCVVCFIPFVRGKCMVLFYWMGVFVSVCMKEKDRGGEKEREERKRERGIDEERGERKREGEGEEEENKGERDHARAI